jgi:PilZ domain-containing protein
MDRSEWLNRLEALHFKVREREPVSEADLAWYRTARSALLETALDVQAVALTSETVRRSSIRIPRAAQVLLEARGWSAQTLTVDLGAGGFAVLLEAPPPVDGWIRATLLLPGEGPVTATVAVADARKVSELVRVALRFSEPAEGIRRRVEDYLMDSVLEQLVFWDDVLEKLRV